MILSAIAAKLKQRAKGDFKGRHYEAALIVQAVSGPGERMVENVR